MAARDDEARRAEEMRENQFERQKQQTALQNAFNDQGELKESWMEDILDVDDISDHLQNGTIRKIEDHLLAAKSKQLVLSNLTGAQVHDRWWYFEVMRLKILSAHPPDDSLITGATRAFLMDDPAEELEPLTPQERNMISQIIGNLQNAVTRSKGGFERKQLNTSINRAETEGQQQENEEGMLSGLF